MLSIVKDSRTSPNSQDFEQATWTNIQANISPLSHSMTSITAGDIATGHFAINMLLDEVLLEIFACYVEESQMRDAWHTLACVCRRWRSIAFGSPSRLNLRIFCSERIPVRENLDFWPPFPIVLTVDYYRRLGDDNILATLEHRDRVSHIKIWNITSSLWEKALPLMQKSFPILTDLNLSYTNLIDMPVPPVVPDLFLDGSATRLLRNLILTRIPFPGLPKLLLSAPNLVHIDLYDIPDSGYIAPEVMVTCLSTLTRLESLMFGTESPRYHPEWERRRSSSSTRSLLPSLTSFIFKGFIEYLEVILDSIDAPLLERLTILFFHQPIFDTLRLAQFISRVPNFKTCNEARLRLDSWHSSFTVLSNTTTNAFLFLEDWNRHADFRMSTFVQFCTSSFPQALIPMLEDLVIVGCFSRPPEQDGIDPSTPWRVLLQPFIAVKNLYLFPEITPYIALVLQELVGESASEFFPVLQNIFLQELPFQFGLIPEGIEQFVAARQRASHPISVSRLEIELMAY